jgi:hypothetical protein
MRFYAVVVVVIAFVLCGCSGSSSPTMLFGEVHIHQFADGAHLSALFVRAPVAASAVPGDEILPGTPPSLVMGTCTLTRLDPTMLPPVPALADAGNVHLSGPNRVVELAWRPPAGYVPLTPLALGTEAFADGVRVDVSGDGGTMPAFSGSVNTPPALVLVQPHALAVGDAGDLTIAWTPAPGDARITVDLVVSRADGASSLVECRVADSDGAVTIPRALLDGVPPRPRDLQLQVSRDDIVRAPSRRSGQGVILHAGFEAALAAHEP